MGTDIHMRVEYRPRLCEYKNSRHIYYSCRKPKEQSVPNFAKMICRKPRFF